MLGRGLAAAALLALPVGVAAAIGFEGSVSGLTGGLGSLASGPDTASSSSDGDRDSLDSAIATISSGPTGGGSRDVAEADGDGSGGGDSGSVTPPVTGVADETPQPTAPVTGGGPGQGPLALPGGGSGTGGSGPVGQLLEGVNNTVNGLLGGGQ